MRPTGAVSLGNLGGIELDLMATRPAPHYQLHTGRSDGAERHRRAGL
jgi:hypothetical protein